MPGGRPKKKSKNISGLCNQQKPMPSITESVAADSSVKNSAQGHNIQESDQDESDVENLTIALDGLKINFEVEYEAEMTEDSEVDEEIELEMLNNVEFGRKLAQMVEHEAENDLDWVLRVLQLVDHKPRPTKYIKGPDMMSKSKHTQQRYQSTWRNQSSLDRFGFWQLPLSTSEVMVDEVDSEVESIVPLPAVCQSDMPLIPYPLSGWTRSASVLLDPSSVDDSEGLGVVTEADSDSSHGTGEGLDLEDWEDELHESISTTTTIRDWGTLCTQIQLDLKKKHKELSLAKVNQLMILSNFATLRLKGATRTKASLEIA
ncbi:hypothetical protein EV401DRAFT_2081935 [Pisolithus croceorrhizus]|nr:hypothetical protein EV401DRAFT_2081935 [Pisolithus croceorrhizus]